MGDDQRYTRRTVLGMGAVAGAALAGCTSGGEPDAGDGGQGATETPTATATATATPTAPTLETFEYPEGASVDGVDGNALASTHRDAITGAGSMTLELSETRDQGNFTDSTDAVKRWGDAGVSVTTEGDVTETLWSPSAERVGYVQMDSGFEQRYRIDNSAPSAEEVTEVPRFQALLKGVEWGEATEVVEDATGDYAVTYESSGVGNENALQSVVFGEVTDLEATILVSEAGHVSELSYDVTAERDRGSVEVAAEATVTAVGETDLQAPEWAETAKEEEGTRFEMRLVEDGEVIELELVNGPEIPRDARVSASSGGRFGGAQLPEAVSVGDRVRLGLAGEGDLRVAVNGSPDGTSSLGRFVHATVDLEKFTLFEGEIRQ